VTTRQRDHSLMRSRIWSTLQLATNQEISDGLAFYPGAHGLCRLLAPLSTSPPLTTSHIAGIYAGGTGIDKEESREMLKRETWMTARESIANGFVDEVLGEQFDFREEKAQSNAMSFLNRLTNPSSEEAVERIAALEADITAQAAEFQSKLDKAEAALQEAATIQAENIELRAKAELVPTLEAKITELENAAKITAEKIDTAAAQKLASMGHGEPLDLGGKVPTEDAPKISHLTGFAKVAASFANKSQTN